MLYLVMAVVKPGITIEDVQRQLNIAMGAAIVSTWYRIAPNVWVVKAPAWTGAEDIRMQLKGLVEPSGRLMITRIDPSEKAGWMDQAFWTWLKTHSS